MHDDGLKQAMEQLLSDQVELLITRTQLKAADVSNLNNYEIHQINVRVDQLRLSISALHQQWMLGNLAECQNQVADYPYDFLRRYFLADCYEHLGYPDLAVGEMYKALLLIDELLDQGGEYAKEAFESVTYLCHGSNDSDDEAFSESDRIEVLEFVQSISVYVYGMLVNYLLQCGCLKDAVEYCRLGMKANPTAAAMEKLNGTMKIIETVLLYRGYSLATGDIDDVPLTGFVRRELYRWNHHEPDRFSPSSLAELRAELAEVAPNLEVRSTELPALSHDATAQQHATVNQLGLFAKKDIQPGEEILNETSLLTANARLHDAFCDACSKALPRELGADSSAVSCDDCEAVFCSPSCYEKALASYHPSICDTDVESIAKGVPAAEAADALYSLLVLRALAMAETQDKHPLDLNEVKYIWGDYQAPPPDPSLVPEFPQQLGTLPFSFKYNVQITLTMLEKMDINPFTTPNYDTWVINTLYAKLRGTASARQGLDGKPEVGAVHPLWCLANHSCDPNVRWEWQGSIKFWAREERLQWEGPGTRSKPGLKKGEEVFSHYCDVDLPVKERREWAVGALGGLCICDRCKWEAGEKQQET